MKRERLRGMVAVITGASSGIGYALSEECLKAGMIVYGLSRHIPDRPLGGVRYKTCDVTDPEACQRVISEIIDSEKHIDYLINNAGCGISGAIEFTDLSEVKKQMDTNFYGCVNMTKAVLSHMRERNFGRIYFTSSLAGIYSIPFQAYYSASKAALDAYMEALRMELKDYDVKAACFLLGDTKTGFTAARSKSEAGADLYPALKGAVSQMEKDEEGGRSAEKVAGKLIRILPKNNPAPYYVIGAEYKFLYFLRRLFSDRMRLWILKIMYCKK